MRYNNVYIDAIGYELAPVVVTSREIEAKLQPLYERLHMNAGQLEALTGIVQRRWWPENYSIQQGAILAAEKTLGKAGVPGNDIDALIYAGVYREYFEPATACAIANHFAVKPDTAVYDITNACLGLLNGILDIANRIELGQIRSGLVVACETAREINLSMIEKLVQSGDQESFGNSLATFTGGSGAVAVLISDGSISSIKGHRLLGAVMRTAPQYHSLCRWEYECASPDHDFAQSMCTDASAVLKYGVELGLKTWPVFLSEMNWSDEIVDKVICHQVGSAHQQRILEALEIAVDRDYSSFEYLGNMGTVSLPLTAALADDYGILQHGQRVGFLGIGSGLNCLMLGLEW